MVLTVPEISLILLLDKNSFGNPTNTHTCIQTNPTPTTGIRTTSKLPIIRVYAMQPCFTIKRLANNETILE